MAFSEFYLTQGADANDQYAGYPLGTDDGPTYATVDASVIDPDLTVIVDNDGTWSGVSAGDWVRWDAGGANQLRRVVSIVGNELTVHRACTAGANKISYVGGAFATFRGAIAAIGETLTTANWPSGASPPRLNVKYESGTAYNSAAVAAADFGTPAETLPFVIEAYSSTPGDLDWRTTTTRAVIDFGTLAAHGIRIDDVKGLNVYVLNLYLVHASTSSTYSICYGDTRIRFFNCVLEKSAGNAQVLPAFRGTALRTKLIRGVAGDTPIVTLTAGGLLYLCHVYGASSTSCDGIFVVSAQATVLRTLVERTRTAITISAAGTVADTTIVTATTAGISLTAAAAVGAFIQTNVISGAGAYGIYNGISGAPTEYLMNCGNNIIGVHTSGYVSSTLISMLPNTELAVGADLFETSDYRIKSTSAAYGVRRDLPSAADADASFLDVGAIMRQRTGGGAVDLPDMMMIGA